jgi:hypothetical protein
VPWDSALVELALDAGHGCGVRGNERYLEIIFEAGCINR